MTSSFGAAPSRSLNVDVDRALLHGLVGGLSSVASGGKFFSGFASAALPALFDAYSSKLGTIGTGVADTIAGGVASVITGGTFAQGAMTAFRGFLYNTAASYGPLVGLAELAAAGLEDAGNPAMLLLDLYAWGTGQHLAMAWGDDWGESFDLGSSSTRVLVSLFIADEIPYVDLISIPITAGMLAYDHTSQLDSILNAAGKGMDSPSTSPNFWLSGRLSQ